MNWHKMYIKAIEMAAIAHNGVSRKFSNEPYFVHPLRTSEIVLDHTGSFELACAAVLHDTLEDTSLTFGGISSATTGRIAILVESVTKNKSLSKAEREIEYLKRFSMSDDDTVIIKLADRYDNVRDAVFSSATPNHFKIAYTKNTTNLLKTIPETALKNQVVETLRSNIMNLIKDARELANWPVEAHG